MSDAASEMSMLMERDERSAFGIEGRVGCEVAEIELLMLECSLDALIGDLL